MQYRTRWFELLMVHKADHGSLPPDNAKNPPPLGRLSPRLKRTDAMDFEPSSEQQMLIDQVRRYVREEIIPLEAKLDPDASELDPADHARLVEKTKAMGLFGIDIPKEFGGPDIDIVTRVLLAIEMAQHRAGLYVPCYGTFGGAGLAQIFEANEDQKERYLYPTLRGEKKPFFGLTEPSGGSDPARAIQTRAERKDNGWVLNGAKIFISGADRAQYGIVFARTDASKGRGGITCFIVDADTPGFHVRRVVHTLRSSSYATELEFKDCWVSDHQVLGEVNKGFAVANDRLTRQRIPYAAGCIGVAIAAHEMAIEWAKMRSTFGEKLANRQAVQWMLVDNEIDIRTARHFTLEAAEKARRGLPFRTEAAIAKLIASEGGGRVVDRSMQIHGGMGMTKDLPLERWYREMRIRRVGEGPSEVQRMVIAREILGSNLQMSKPRPGPLAGIKVVEFGQNLAGPYCGQILAFLGAEVVKVERPEGDDARKWGPPFVEGDALGFIALNRGKKSITCDLADKAEREALIERIGAADVFVHNLRADVPAKFGIDGADAHQALSAADLCRPRRLRPRRPVEGPAGLRADHPGGGRPDLAERRSVGPGGAHRRLDHRPVDRHVDGDRRAGGDRPARRHRAGAAWSTPRCSRAG